MGCGGGGGNEKYAAAIIPGVYEFIIGNGGVGGGYLNPGTYETKAYRGTNGGDTVAFGKTYTGGKAGSVSTSTGTGGAGGTPNGRVGNASNTAGCNASLSGGAPNGGKLGSGSANAGGDGYIEISIYEVIQ